MLQGPKCSEESLLTKAVFGASAWGSTIRSPARQACAFQLSVTLAVIQAKHWLF